MGLTIHDREVVRSTAIRAVEELLLLCPHWAVLTAKALTRFAICKWGAEARWRPLGPFLGVLTSICQPTKARLPAREAGAQSVYAKQPEQ